MKIIGTPKVFSNTVAIVIQGPNSEKIETIYERFLFHNPNIILIFATYFSDKELSDYEKKLIDDGLLVLLLIEYPPLSYERFWATNHANQNLQRLTSYTGLKYAQDLNIKCSLKIRSDTFLGKPNVIKYFLDQIANYPILHTDDNVIELKSRIIVSGQGTIIDPRFPHPFHVRDHWYFGCTEDLVKFFNLSSSSHWAEIKCSCPESAITEVWIKDLGIKVKDTNELIGRYFIIEDSAEVEQIRLSETMFWFLDYECYKKYGVEYLKEVYEKADLKDNVTTKEKWTKILTSIWMTETFGT